MSIIVNKTKGASLPSIPPAPGTYALLLKSQSNHEITIGKLGRFIIQPGYYAYVGSAFGPGGLRARIGHHLRPGSKPHWHIDYLKQCAGIIGFCYSTGMEPLEHHWATIIQSGTAAAIPIPRFGASDCKCPAHLFFFETRPDLPAVLKSGFQGKCCESVIPY